MTKKSIPKKMFTIKVTPPTNRLNLKGVTIYEDDRFIINGKLSSELYGKSMTICFTEDAKHLCLEECDPSEQTIKVTHSGRKVFPGTNMLLRKNKIGFPAKYEVWFNPEENFWQGDLLENPTVPVQNRR